MILRPRLLAAVICLGAAVFAAGLSACGPTEPEVERPRKLTTPRSLMALYHLLSEVFPEQTITDLNGPMSKELPTAAAGNYIVITNNFDPSTEDVEALRSFVRKGGSALIVAEEFNGEMQKEFGFETHAASDTALENCLRFASPSFEQPRTYCLTRLLPVVTFGWSRADGMTVAATLDSSAPTLLRYEIGSGYLYLSSTPFAFTNEIVLDTTVNGYPFGTLSYLPRGPVLWDDHYRPSYVVRPRGSSSSGGGGGGGGGGGDGSGSDDNEESSSPLQFLLDHEPLRWALYTLLAGIVLFVIFMGRRRQRPIPIVRPLPNSTLEFVATVGQLYYRNAAHRNIAEKKVTYFLDQLRTTYNLNTGDRSDEFFNMLSARSGVSQDELRSLFGAIDGVRHARSMSPEDLTQLSEAIERFLAASSRRMTT